jgi:hypothetical protein
MAIVEIYPAPNGSSAPLQRIAAAPRDLASSLLLLLYCALSAAAACMAVAAAAVAGAYHARHRSCILSYMPNGARALLCVVCVWVCVCVCACVHVRVCVCVCGGFGAPSGLAWAPHTFLGGASSAWRFRAHM